MNDIRSKKVSLVLGSGGARGLTQIGVLKVIKEQGFQIDEIAGCSIGALLGGLYAQNKLELYEKWITGLSTIGILNLLDFSIFANGVLKGDRIIDAMKELVPDQKIENFSIEFSAIATNLNGETSVTFDSGSFYQAVRASIAFPGVIAPVKRNGSLLVDGGVLNPLPLSLIKKHKENLVIAVNLDGPTEDLNQEVDYGYITLLQHSFRAMRRQLSKMAIDFYKPDIVIDIPKDLSGTWEFNKASIIIEEGSKFAREQLKKYSN